MALQPAPRPPRRATTGIARLALAAALALPAAVEPTAGHADPGATARTPVHTTHYELRSEGTPAEAAEWAKVLEAAWPQLKRFFGAEPRLLPDQRLLVSVHEDAQGWARAIRAAGGLVPGDAAGGYYDPVSRGAFLYRQPTTWYTRTLLIHEAAHQFHYLAKTNNRAPGATWYIEGLAEHLSHHTWDGATLRLGVVPPLSLEDRAGKALARMTARDFDLARLVDGGGTERPEAMHLVRFLLQGEGGAWAARFEGLAEQLDRGALARAQFARQIGDPQRVLAGLHGWLPTVQEPLMPVHVDWDARGARAVRGTSGGVSVCRLRRPASGMAAEFRPPATGRWAAGLLLHVTDLKDFTVALANPWGLKVQRYTAGRWEYLPVRTPSPPLDGQAWRLEALREGTQVTLRANGVELGRYDLPGDALGLAVDACTMDFTDLAWVTR
jgi:hypothetical protein